MSTGRRRRLPLALRNIARALAHALRWVLALVALITVVLPLLLFIPAGLVAIAVLELVQASMVCRYAARDWYAGLVVFWLALTAVAFVSVAAIYVRGVFVPRGRAMPPGADGERADATGPP